MVGKASRTAQLSLAEWAVLGLVASGPSHAFAIVKALKVTGELGRIWSVPTPVVYRAVNNLRDLGLISAVGEERSDAGPPRTVLTITPSGRRQLKSWLRTPVVHMRDVRSVLLMKLALLAQLGESAQPLVSAQLEAFEPLVEALERQAAHVQSGAFDATLVRWRLESARAVRRFLSALAERCNVSARSLSGRGGLRRDAALRHGRAVAGRAAGWAHHLRQAHQEQLVPRGEGRHVVTVNIKLTDHFTLVANEHHQF